MELTHFNAEGRARMVDVGPKEQTVRRAVARAIVKLNPQTYALVKSGSMKKGDVLAVSQVAGVAKVLHADSPALANALAENLAAQVLALAGHYSHILFAATASGKNVAPRVAAQLDVAQVSDITKVISPDTFERPIYAGNAFATVLLPTLSTQAAAQDTGAMHATLNRALRNTIVIMTSNIGTRQLKDFGRGVGFSTTKDDETDNEHAKYVIQKALKKAFAPEFLNRVDDVVMFNQLSKEHIQQIIDLELNELYKRVESLNYKLKISSAVKEFLAEKGYDPQFGARPLKRAIQKYLEDEMAEIIIKASISEGDTISVGLDKKNEKLLIRILSEKKEISSN